MLWEDLKIRLQALTMGTASYSEFSNPIYTYTYLKNTPTSKKLVICLQSAVFGTQVQRHSAAGFSAAELHLHVVVLHSTAHCNEAWP